MATKLHSFIDIFHETFETDGDSVELKKIVIPIIQRDYAQGRKNTEVDRVRKRFLQSLHTAITEKPITLDFVYGDIDANGVMTPLDGQQRLTTLFLLHWYAAKKEHVSEDESSFLRNFSYETRYSARYFCTELVNFNPSFETDLSKDIINQAWFPLDWKKDPTISSMLVMLDTINESFSDIPNLWTRLKNNAITFYFLPIRDMGLTDELYIKMNSRGKPLTQFEHFKAELERNIRGLNEKATGRVLSKVDGKWTDLLWRYRNSGSGSAEDEITDDEFLHYFKFICDVICYKNGESPQGKSIDEFELLQEYFSKDNEDALENIQTLESYFDCWCQIAGYDNPADFLHSLMSYEHEIGKIVVDTRYDTDIFADCLHLYQDRSRFPLNRFVLLYAVTYYLRNQEKTTHEEFARRLRMISNLIQNSVDEVSDRIDRNRIPAVLAQTEAIIESGNINDDIDNSYNVNQLQEEKDKIEFLNDHPERAEELFALEDHPMLKGQIGIIGLENLDLHERFESLFTCDWDLIDKALMATGNYGQMERNKWRYQYASKSLQLAWDELFHKNANSGFDNTGRILCDLLSKYETFSNDILRSIADDFIFECEKKHEYPWRYYYVKYDEFRPGSYGKLSNSNAEECPYMFSVMQTKSQLSSSTYMPYLKTVDAKHLSVDDMGQRIVYGDEYIECDNSSYLIKYLIDDSIKKRLDILQNTNGIDIEDRVVKLREYVSSFYQDYYVEETDSLLDVKTSDDSSVERKLNRSQQKRYEFWTRFNEVIAERHYPFSTRKPNTDYTYHVAIGKTGKHISLDLIDTKGYVNVNLIIVNDKEFYYKLLKFANDIRRELGVELEWDAPNGKNVSKIKSRIDGLDFDNPSNYDDLMNQMIDRALLFSKVFKKYLD